MAVSLIKPDLGDDAEAVDLVAVEALADDDEGAAAEQPSRLRAWWGQILEDAEPTGHQAPVPRPARTRRVQRLQPRRPGRCEGRHGGDPPRRLDADPPRLAARPQRRTQGEEGEAEPRPGTPRRKAEDAPKKKGAKPAAGKKRGSKTTPAKKTTREGGHRQHHRGRRADRGHGRHVHVKTVIPAAVGLTADTASWVAGHPLDVARPVGAVVVVFVVAAWIVGGVVGAPGGHDEEHRRRSRRGSRHRDHRSGIPRRPRRRSAEWGDRRAAPDGGEAKSPPPNEEAAQARIQLGVGSGERHNPRKRHRRAPPRTHPRRPETGRRGGGHHGRRAGPPGGPRDHRPGRGQGPRIR